MHSWPSHGHRETNVFAGNTATTKQLRGSHGGKSHSDCSAQINDVPLLICHGEHPENMQHRCRDTDHQLHPLEFRLETRNAVLHFGVFEPIEEFFRVDADGKGPDSDQLAFEFDSVWSAGKAEKTRARAQEVTSIVVSVEAYEITV